MTEGKLKNGFEYKIEDDRFDDYEMFEKLCAIDKDDSNISLIIDVFIDLLGEDQYDALKEHLRSKKGKISTKAMVEALHEILGSEGEEIKNS